LEPGKEKPMLYAGKERLPDKTPRLPARGRGESLTDFLLDVLASADSYDAQIVQAERDEDLELAAFLRELRRQDVGRTREAVRLLRRPYREEWGGSEKEIGA
jgi:hypothetical protein